MTASRSGASRGLWALRLMPAALCVQALLWALPGTAQAPQEDDSDPPAQRAAEAPIPDGEGPSVDSMADVEQALEAYEASEQISEDAAVSFPVDI
jgi:hypothetical protein